MESLNAFDRNKQFFGSSLPSNQISKLLVMLKEQDARIDQLAKRVTKLESKPVLVKQKK